MKRSAIVAAAALLAGMGLLASAPTARAAGLKCTGADGKTACTAAQVADINHGILVGKRMHKPLLMVKEVTLGKNGALLCTQTDGSACTDEQLSEVKEWAMSTHSHGGKSDIQVVKTMDKASPLL